MSLREMTSRYIQRRIYLGKYRRPPIAVPFAFDVRPPDSHPRIAVVVHCYYADLIDEMLQHIQQIPLPYRLHISTDTGDKRAKIVRACEARGLAGVDVRLVPNRGRDMAPRYITFRDVYATCDYFLSLHSKYSFQNGTFGVKWRKQLLQTLTGSPEIVRSNLTLLADPRIGLVFPKAMIEAVPRFRWGTNFDGSARLAQRMGIEVHPEFCPDYPEGGMYWGKPAAIQAILDLNLELEDFPEETGQLDGELMHVLERVVIFAAQKQGLGGCRIDLASADAMPAARNGDGVTAAISDYLAGQAAERVRYDKRGWTFRRRSAP